MSKRAVGALALACVGSVLSGCAGTPADDRPVVRIAEAAQPLQMVPLGPFLPTAQELSTILATGPNGLLAPPVEGDADVLLRSVADAHVTPVECVSAAYRMQEIVYDTSPVRSVASSTWAGGGFEGPPVTGFFGVVQMADPVAAQEFFASLTGQWQRCNGKTVAMRPAMAGAAGAGEISRVTGVSFDARVVSASVLHASAGTGSPTGIRAVGLADDCIVEVELVDPRAPVDARQAVAVADVILDKIASVS